MFYYVFFFLMIRRPPRSTLSSSSAASDVYKRQTVGNHGYDSAEERDLRKHTPSIPRHNRAHPSLFTATTTPVSYTHLRAHETPEHLVCRLLLEKKKKKNKNKINASFKHMT
eukprot:TRINITY_DN1888_c0_g1_i1.p1 TRINITY_DN1888_c0_g1~~TRINITY_DN1888_c0_g1_i1.p1  ORF type:complete len:112 (+),score=39.42 TRINITY_DN1888_c0_g1_i1:119-454(+)